MTMRLAMIGLVKMGANMARRLCRKGVEVVGYDRDVATVAGLAAETSMVAAASVADAVSKLTAPRVVWLMLPSGDPTETQLKELAAMLSPGAGAPGPSAGRAAWPAPRPETLLRAAHTRMCRGRCTGKRSASSPASSLM